MENIWLHGELTKKKHVQKKQENNSVNADSDKGKASSGDTGPGGTQGTWFTDFPNKGL